jgi:DNA-3-methyladenine glycosylase II
MFTIFALHRLDVWPTGDLGVRAGFAVIFGVPVPHAAALEPLGERFRPYRSVLAWYCWQALDAGRAKTIA